MIPNITITRNSAYIDHIKLTAYYGPLSIDQISEEWSCVIKKNGKEVFSANNSQLLEVSFGESPSDMLMAGLALYLCR